MMVTASQQPARESGVVSRVSCSTKVRFKEWFACFETDAAEESFVLKKWRVQAPINHSYR